VDQGGNVLDLLVQQRRDETAAKRFFRTLLKRLWLAPQVLEHEYSPLGIELGPQGVFVLHPAQACGRGMLRDRRYDKNGGETRVGLASGLAPIHEELLVLTKPLQMVF